MYYIMELSGVKNKFQKLFGLYVGKNVLGNDYDGEIGQKQAKENEIAIYFSDIAGFTDMSEKLSPKQNIDFLNIYLEKQSKNISLNNGFIDKYIGDAVMAFWENNDSCFEASKSAILNVKSIKEINEIVKNNLNIDINLNTRIGLHYGKAIVGDIGSEEYKLNYTIIGDNVNLASRLEGINKYYNTSICASENFVEKITDSNEFLFRKLDKIQVKGKENAIEIYEIIPEFKNILSKQYLQHIEKFINMFEDGLQKYFKGNFEEALSIFKKCQNIKKDKTCNIFILRCEDLIKNKPKNWNGVWKHENK
ncbi:adenylate/guanylate cyclase domain-containing protein [Candidatus Absconditicoccus praedator]|uniref:adenylate/guanylate cyclase domain-containing protein n=1 Tax=Candidatus Absconditicoccus praedator TaxID=2735562 RepID=UPI001E347713|nr:adenylate/guanylate cyclase domain-containing protein [Candidatus Absconditicoccus praedator]UFX82713.1 adenylate/guanylate cyclase domain-containing protein [Candidatus Absconditicoccus praedator]